MLPLHVIGGIAAILSGFVALFALKGARLHRTSGTVFVYAILVMSLSGAAMAVGPLRSPAFRLIPLVALVTMAYWLWRFRRTRIARAGAGVRTAEAI